MNSQKFLQQAIGLILVVSVFLAGCAAPAATPTPSPTLPPPPPPPPTFAPLPPPPPPPPTFAPPPTPAQPKQPTGQPTLFKFIQTVQVTPDDNYLTGGFTRINYVPATSRFVVTFGGKVAKPSGECNSAGKAYSYKEYTVDMQETGKSGVFSCALVDSGSLMVGNDYYFAAMTAQGNSVGWQITKYNAANWEKLADIFYPLNLPYEGDSDMTVAYANGQIDISNQYNPAGKWQDGTQTHHNFFSTDLKYLGKKILSDTPLISGSSMIFANGIYHIISADHYAGDLVVAKYNEDWEYLGMKKLFKQAHWPQGVVFDGERFYIAYLNTSQRSKPGFFPFYPNVRLAAFDIDWNLIDDIAVTNFSVSDNKMTGRPWVMFYNNRLYVSYDIGNRDPVTHEELLDAQSYVSVYELTQEP